jgi:hypothetical protein
MPIMTRPEDVKTYKYGSRVGYPLLTQKILCKCDMCFKMFKRTYKLVQEMSDVFEKETGKQDIVLCGNCTNAWSREVYFKGKTWDEIFGSEQAKKAREKLSQNTYLHSDKIGEYRSKLITRINKSKRGKKYKTIYGDRAEVQKSNRGASRKGKTYEEIYGPEKAAELRLNRRQHKLGRPRKKPK